MRESVNVYINLTENETPHPDTLVGLQINNGQSWPLVIRTLNGSSVQNTWEVEILGLTPCDKNGNPKTYFKKGTPAYFKVTMKNNSPQTLNVLTAINIYDRYMVPLDYSSFEGPMADGSVDWVILQITIPDNAIVGDAIVYANLYSDWPSNGGIPYCPEKSASFKITNGVTYTSTNIIPAANIPKAGLITHRLAYRLSPNPKAGTYTVYATSQYNTEKTFASATFEVKESSSVPPNAWFFYSPPKPYTGCIISFDASLSTPEGPENDIITSYWFDFGDGANSTSTGQSGPIQYHSYAEGKVYYVTLNVTDNEGLWCTQTQPVTVYATYGPTADFTYTTPYANVTTTFDASSTTQGWNGTYYPPIVEYTWDFGDETPNVTKTSPLTTHVYTELKNYTVTLKVTDSIGQQDTLSKNITVSTPPEIRDIAIKDIKRSKTAIYNGTGSVPGGAVNITVVVRNNGTFKENFNITLYYNDTIIGKQNVTDMYGLSELNVTFTWDATNIRAGTYTIKAEASTVENETNTTNNIFVDGTIMVKIQGDIDGSGKVEYTDLFYFGKAWMSKPGAPNWNPEADFDSDGSVGYTDLFVFGKNWMKQA